MENQQGPIKISIDIRHRQSTKGKCRCQFVDRKVKRVKIGKIGGKLLFRPKIGILTKNKNF